MRKIYNEVGNLKFKGEKEGSILKTEITDAQIIKEYSLNGAKFLYVQLATHRDSMIVLGEDYKNIDITLELPAINLDESSFGEKTIVSKTLKNMFMVYQDTLYCHNRSEGLVMVFTNDEHVSSSGIEFIMNDIRETKKTIDKKEPTIKLNWLTEQRVSGIERALIDIADKINNNKVKKDKHYYVCIDKPCNNKDYTFAIMNGDFKLVKLRSVNTLQEIVNTVHDLNVKITDCIFYIDNHGFGKMLEDKLTAFSDDLIISNYSLGKMMEDRIFNDLDASVLAICYSEELDEDSKYNFAVALREINEMKKKILCGGKVKYDFENGKQFSEVILALLLEGMF